MTILSSFLPSHSAQVVKLGGQCLPQLSHVAVGVGVVGGWVGRVSC